MANPFDQFDAPANDPWAHYQDAPQRGAPDPWSKYPDYDYAAFNRSGMKRDERGHYPDKFKTPSHITFSDESQYSGVNGGPVGGHWGEHDFSPSMDNLKNVPLDKMRDYFRQNEPGYDVNVPTPPHRPDDAIPGGYPEAYPKGPYPGGPGPIGAISGARSAVAAAQNAPQQIGEGAKEDWQGAVRRFGEGSQGHSWPARVIYGTGNALRGLPSSNTAQLAADIGLSGPPSLRDIPGVPENELVPNMARSERPMAQPDATPPVESRGAPEGRQVPGEAAKGPSAPLEGEILPPDRWVRYQDAPPKPPGYVGGQGEKLVVALRNPDGTIKYGKPGEFHPDLLDVKDGQELHTPGEMGFARPGGPFMTRREAFDFVEKNEPEKIGKISDPDFRRLEAGEYIEPLAPQGISQGKVESALKRVNQSQATATGKPSEGGQGGGGLPTYPAGAAASPSRLPAFQLTEATGSRPLISQQIGLQRRVAEKAITQLEPTIAHEYNVTPYQRRLYRNWIETRSLGGTAIPKQLTPELLKSADLVKAINDDLRFELERLDDAGKQHFITDYLSHMYKDTPRLRELIGGAAKGEGRGAGGHLKERSIPTYDEAEKLGLEPKFDTVGETVQETARMMTRHIAERDIENELRAQGLIHTGPRPPYGWVPIKEGRLKYGEHYAPPSIAKDYNRFFMRSNIPWADTIMEVNNALRGIKFTGPPYHLMTELIETATHDYSSMLEQLVNKQFGRAAGSAAKGLTHTGLPANYWRGSRGYRYYLGKPTGPHPGQGSFRNMLEAIRKEISPEDREIVDLMTQGDAIQGRHSMDVAYGNVSTGTWLGRRGWLAGFKKGVYKAEIGRATKNAVGFVKSIPGAPKHAAYELVMAPFRGITKITSEAMGPLFGELIPKAKFGAQMQKIQDWLQANPEATHEQKLLAVAKIKRNADFLMGELQEDTMFMNRNVMMAMRMFFLSPGWNIGTLGWAGPGIGGTAKAIGGAPINLAARAIGKPAPLALPSISKASPTWTPAMATTYGAILETVMWGSIATVLMTGRKPTSTEDIISPPTGGVNARGEPDRLRPSADASFIAEISRGLGYPGAGAAGFVAPDLGAGFADALHSKLNTIPSLMWDIGKNEDYRHKPIMKGPTFKDGVEQAITHIMSEALTPIGMGEKGPINAPASSNIPLFARALGMGEAGMQFTNPQGWKDMREKQTDPKAFYQDRKKSGKPVERNEHAPPAFHP